MSAIATLSAGPISVAALPFRLRGARFVAIIVKVTLQLQQDQPMSIGKPHPIQPRDLGLIVPTPELVVDAVGYAPRGGPPPGAVRIAVAQGTTMLLSKEAPFPGDRLFVSHFGALPSRVVVTDFTELADDHAPDAFQLAPSDQRVTEWRGGELLAFVNLHPTLSNLRVYVPDLQAAALIEAPGDTPTELALQPTTIFVEPHTLRAELIFRGVDSLSRDPSELNVTAEVAPSDARIDWLDVKAHARGAKAKRAAPPGTKLGPEGTLVMEKRADLSSTLVLEPKSGANQSSTPFAGGAWGEPAAPPTQPIPGAPWGTPQPYVQPTTFDMERTVDVPLRAPAPPGDRAPKSKRGGPKSVRGAGPKSVRGAGPKSVRGGAVPAYEEPPTPLMPIAPKPAAKPERRKAVWRDEPTAPPPTQPVPELPPERPDGRTPLYKRFKR